MDIARIFAGNQIWAAARIDKDSEFFSKLAEGQNPDILYIGCADSRVTAEELTGTGPGDLFVHRNVANLVPNNDINSAAVINYAVVHLKVEHIVICGHYGCGGIAAAMESTDLGVLNPWLRNIRDVYRLHTDELNAIDDLDARYRRLVELNVQEQCVNVLKIREVQQANAVGKLQVHGWVFDIATGTLIDLELDTDEILADIREIYHLA